MKDLSIENCIPSILHLLVYSPSVFNFASFALGLGGWGGVTLPKKVGNYQDPKIIKKCKAERHKFGSFYYRYPHGESASDVVRSFLHQ